ncbi:alanine racemase [Nesterenkonia haasae]|uniref:alanine racemase n=1 Tax=Nesterenkonia haasae TaxID=2587813 RepID=UPI001391DDC4|nr:alanine racemase [Nesterenkonia haasae]NDK32209.1 amino acid deaminase [Nesterenkonia haasae]
MSSPAPDWRRSMAKWLETPDPADKHWSPAIADAVNHPVPLTDVPTPSLTLNLSDVAHNIAVMQEWSSQRNMDLAPHGKTTMAPGLWQWQLDAGSWAISVANGFQLRVARQSSIQRVIVANELISPTELTWLGGELNRTTAQEFDVTCWADSLESVQQMDHHLRAVGASRPLGVCVELGAPGSRTGIRTLRQARATAEAINASDTLELRGLAAYEGSVPRPPEGSTGTPQDRHAEAIRGFLSQVREAFIELSDLHRTSTPLLSAGGSAWFDLVAEQLAPALDQVSGSRVVLRSGAYAIHDHGHYSNVTPGAQRSGPHFQPAATAYTRVLSTPEPGLAILDAGKRDLPYDIHLPCVLGVHRDGHWQSIDAEVYSTDDQHAYVRLPSDTLRVGELLRLGLSHPCTMFDKWRSVLLVEHDHIVGCLRTYF